jgi:hypothetical protein
MTQTLSPGQEFLLSLERERYNVAYRVPAEVKKETDTIRYTVKPCTRKHFTKAGSEERDKHLFNAGRYAAGATDDVAVLAHEWLMRELDAE